eukprot:753370-Hanusia_phi.AAC.7
MYNISNTRVREQEVGAMLPRAGREADVARSRLPAVGMMELSRVWCSDEEQEGWKGFDKLSMWGLWAGAWVEVASR